MQLWKTTTIVFMFVSMFVYSEGQAYTIKEGTISIAGGSLGSLGYSNTEYSNYGSHTKDAYFSAGGGYFIKNDLELGVAFTLYHYSYDSSIREETNSYAIQPYVTLHTPIAVQASLFYGIGFGYEQRRSHYSSGFVPGQKYKSTGTIVSAKFGWEYFFNDWSAFQIALNAMRSNDKSKYSETRLRQDSIVTSFGFSILFK